MAQTTSALIAARTVERKWTTAAQGYASWRERIEGVHAVSIANTPLSGTAPVTTPRADASGRIAVRGRKVWAALTLYLHFGRDFVKCNSLAERAGRSR